MRAQRQSEIFFRFFHSPSLFCYTWLALANRREQRFDKLQVTEEAKRPSWVWVALLAVSATAVFLRFWQLGEWPPGLYRDEAYNGLDALRVLAGEHALFFPANNGREPTYIYLTAGAIALLGRSVLAVRLAAAVVGSLTTLAVYLLAREWFGWRVGLLAAALWAITLWPMHLGRVGLRAGLLPLLLALLFWLGTRAYRTPISRKRRWLWLATGLIYGAAFYTYLAVRFTPVLLAAIAIGDWRLAIGNRRLAINHWLRAHASRLTDYALFALGTAVALLPLVWVALQQPEILLGRTGQVGVWDTAVNGGDLGGTLLRHTSAALGMFFWQGDTILRHNPAGRPLFDWLMALPFLLGVGWCIYHWQRRAAAVLLLWAGIMLGPTILAADAPHFLRAVGVLPAAIILPALGLAQLGNWLRWRWPALALIGALLAGSTAVTVRDYVAYSQNPDTAYLFEQGARLLAQQVNQTETTTAVFVDERYWSGWPSVRFLVTDAGRVNRFTPEAPPAAPLPLPARLFVWPYGDTAFVAAALPATARIWPQTGPLARGDLEPEPYPLYTRYDVDTAVSGEPIVIFGGTLALLQAQAVWQTDGMVRVALLWQAETAVVPPLTAFVHLAGAAGLVAQEDAPPGGLTAGQANWPPGWWRPGLQLYEQRLLRMPTDFAAGPYELRVGVYDAAQNRLPVTLPDGRSAGDSWSLTIERETKRP